MTKLKHPPVLGAAPVPAKRSNGTQSLIQLNVTEDQLNSFFLRLSIAERALIVNTYLAGGR